jgi:hypothetical protein
MVFLSSFTIWNYVLFIQNILMKSITNPDIFFFSCKIIVGLVFLLSAFAKIFDFPNTVQYLAVITSINYSIVEIGLVVLIQFEIIISIFIFISKYYNNLIFKVVTSALICFILVNIIFMGAGISNCACFGTKYSANPFISIIKNLIVLIIIIIIRNRNIQNKKTSIV